MATRSISEDDLVRLREARDAADRQYNEALSALDRALTAPPSSLPLSPPAPDEHQIAPLNQQWHVLEPRPAMPTGLKGRLAWFVWRLVAPLFERQQAFNAALVDHLNRNAGPLRESQKALDSTIALVVQQLHATAAFQSRLILYVQQLTPYVDTKDYEFAGLARRINEDAHEAAEWARKAAEQFAAERAALVARDLAGGLSGLSDEVLRRYESLRARDERYDGALTELKTAVASVQQLTQALRRELERRTQNSTIEAPSTQHRTQHAAPSTQHAAEQLLASDKLRSHQYVGFEDLFRGSEVEIQGRMADYVEIFRGRTDVLDVGCGRGEFVEALGEAGVTARGIDLNHEMVARCRARGLDVTEADALSYLRGLADESLGGLIAAQVVEHLAPDYLLGFLTAAFDKLRPGSPLVLETINTASWAAFFDSYVRDLTHVRPIHPDTLRYLVTASGFADARIEWRSPYPPESKLHHVPDAVRAELAAAPGATALADAFDRNVDHLNERLFTHMDYAVIARRA